MIDTILDQSASIKQERTLQSVMNKVGEEHGELFTAFNKNMDEFVDEAADNIIVVTDAVYRYVSEQYGNKDPLAAKAILECAILKKLEKWRTVYGSSFEETSCQK